MGNASFPFNPFSYPTLSVDFHHGEDAESDGNGGFQGSETRLKSVTKLVGDDVIARPENARTWHQVEDAADEEGVLMYYFTTIFLEIPPLFVTIWIL